jgi:ferritin-like metal-binding protein YciE
MAETVRSYFVTGLRNAHAMEVQARELMERQIERTAEYPELKSRLKLHLDETNVQIQRIEGILESMDEKTSKLKDTAFSVMGNVSAMMHATSDDEIIKNMLANNMFENFEIGTYKALIAMCDPADEPQAEPILRSSLNEEVNMARWVDQHLEPITLMFLAKIEQKQLQVVR